MRNFARFDSMITPRIIVAFFWIGVVIITGGYLVSLNNYWAYALTGNLFVARVIEFVGFIFSLVFLRTVCELMIVIFKINSNLSSIAKRQTT